jgi:hypothetical protein
VSKAEKLGVEEIMNLVDVGNISPFGTRRTFKADVLIERREE